MFDMTFGEAGLVVDVGPTCTVHAAPKCGGRRRFDCDADGGISIAGMTLHLRCDTCRVDPTVRRQSRAGTVGRDESVVRSRSGITSATWPSRATTQPSAS